MEIYILRAASRLSLQTRFSEFKKGKHNIRFRVMSRKVGGGGGKQACALSECPEIPRKETKENRKRGTAPAAIVSFSSCRTPLLSARGSTLMALLWSSSFIQNVWATGVVLLSVSPANRIKGFLSLPRGLLSTEPFPTGLCPHPQWLLRPILLTFSPERDYIPGNEFLLKYIFVRISKSRLQTSRFNEISNKSTTILFLNILVDKFLT